MNLDIFIGYDNLCVETRSTSDLIRPKAAFSY
jgi:hypothetical protein